MRVVTEEHLKELCEGAATHSQGDTRTHEENRHHALLCIRHRVGVTKYHYDEHALRGEANHDGAYQDDGDEADPAVEGEGVYM